MTATAAATPALVRLAPPNGDLAVEADGRVWKWRDGAWQRLDYWLPAGSWLRMTAAGPVEEAA